MSASIPDALALVDGLTSRGVSPADAAKTAAEILGHESPNRLLSVPELAALVGRSERTVQRWCNEESVPVVKTGSDTIGIHFPTFLAVCTKFAQPRGSRGVVRAGDIAARIVQENSR